MDASLDSLLLRAVTIGERLSPAFEGLPGQASDAERAGRRLAAWCRACANGDWSLFHRRLARDGLTFEHVLSRLATIRRRADAPLPRWLQDAAWIDAALATTPSLDALTAIRACRPAIAFDDLLAALIQQSIERLHASVERHAYVTLGSAVANLAHQLARSLSDFVAPALYERMLAFNANEDVRWTYNDFIKHMRDGGWRALFEGKPVLLRLLATIVGQWLDTTSEFASRLAADLPELRRRLLLGAAPDLRVVEVADYLSDRHNEGRTVKIVTFADGQRIVYKPKDLRLDVALLALLEQLSAMGAPIDLRVPRVLVQEGYGWAECISYADAPDDDGGVRYFRAAGAWLCLFHLLAATDMHEQNVIAADARPVPVDVETMLQPVPLSTEPPVRALRASALVAQRMIDSVTMTGFLPWHWRTPNTGIAVSGGLSDSYDDVTVLAWRNVNSLAMEPYRESSRAPRCNLPRVRGQRASLSLHVDDLCEGFEQYTSFLSRRADDVSALLADFDGLPVRRVLRNTRFYFLLLERLRNPASMTDGAEWSAQADFVARLADWSVDDDPLWPLVGSERNSLISLCVPYFASRTNDASIFDAAERLTASSGTTGIARAADRLRTLSTTEVAWQVDIIRMCTRAMQSSGDVGPSRVPRPVRTSDTPDVKQLFGRVASDIARHLSSIATMDAEGASWMGLEWLGHSGVWRPAPLGVDMYSGAAGLGIFFAACATVMNDAAARRMALSAVTPMRHTIRGGNAARFLRDLGLGGATGCGSLIYALTTMSTLLSDVSLIEDAVDLCAHLTDDLIGADRTLDAFDGSAGCILALVRLHDATRDPLVLDRATRCAEHILAQPRIGAAGRQSWLGPTVAARDPHLLRPLNGMSHGAAGFALALGSLGNLTDRADLMEAARECIAYENASFSPDRRNWPDFRGMENGSEAKWLCQWCHGAAGIGIARIALIQRGGIHGSPIDADVDHAVSCTEHTWPYRGDNLCCGNLGQIELLSEASVLRSDDRLMDMAEQRLATILAAATTGTDYAFDGIDRRFDLGLFRGLAGIGYACLRRLNPRVPNVLAWA